MTVSPLGGLTDAEVEAGACALFVRSQLDGSSCDSPEDAARWWRNLRADEKDFWLESTKEDLAPVERLIRERVIRECVAVVEKVETAFLLELRQLDRESIGHRFRLAELAAIGVATGNLRALLSAPGEPDKGVGNG